MVRVEKDEGLALGFFGGVLTRPILAGMRRETDAGS
jgi:hypothetical protein